jgi:predicted ATPase
MVRSRAGIAETEDPHRSRTRLRTAVAELVGDLDEQRWIEPRLAGLLGLEPMPAGDRTELFAALRAFFHNISQRGTTVLVFEDLHWADPGLFEFIEELVERSNHRPILVVTLARRGAHVRG